MPLPVRMLNSLNRNTHFALQKRISLRSDELLESASRKTGLRQWGEPGFRDALDALLESVEGEGRLTFFGRFTLRQFLIGSLCNRLRIIATLKRFPEIHQHALQKPVFITGWYRTGTTYLHNLLAAHPDVRAPLYWELRNPCPSTDPRKTKSARIIRNVHLTNRIHRYLAPGFNDAHAMAADKPEECLHLFENCFMGTNAFFITEAKKIAWWLLESDMRQGYAFYRDQLELLNWLRPGERWVLKWPYHLWHLDALLDTFPDAFIIHVHRHPIEAVPSVCSLAALARTSFCESVDGAALGRFWLDYYEAGLQRARQSRKYSDERRFIDVPYEELVSNPRGVIQRILQETNLMPDQSVFNKAGMNGKAKKKSKPSGHRYSLSQFDLDGDEIRERFTDYILDFDLNSK